MKTNRFCNESGEDMQLKISNVAKIKEAVIKVDGITVIAGENNAGKSTIGKLLFAIFNSMYNMDEKIAQEKKNRIQHILHFSLQSEKLLKQNVYTEQRYRYVGLADRLARYIMELPQDVRKDNLEEALLEYFSESAMFEDKAEQTEFVKESACKLEPIINISDQKVMTEVITRWFARVFEGQISPLKEEGIESTIELDIKGKKLSYVFKENKCIDWNSEFNILHEAFYIDNPFIVDAMSNNRYVSAKMTERHLLGFLCEENEDMFEGVFDVVTAKEKLHEIYDLLGEVIKGDIVHQEGEYCLKSSDYTKPLSVRNLSTGLKSFALVKRLLENGAIKEKDVLILDEPEIHLHPEWQLLYAKLIVLLQKEFDLSMVITTHSPYFLDAIDIYSHKYETACTTNYYLAENEGDISSLRDVTDNIDSIYKKLSDPMQELENLRYGLS